MACGASNLRGEVVGIDEKAGFCVAAPLATVVPEATDIDHRLLIGCGANIDRYEDWCTNATLLRDTQQPLIKHEPSKWYAADAVERDDALGDCLVTGQVPGDIAVHTATDVPLSAFEPSALDFIGVIDNTDVLFKLAHAAIKATTASADANGARKPRSGR
ncbi:MAG: hypothetical protein V4569_07970 [Pseudomonadota bacterium]